MEILEILSTYSMPVVLGICLAVGYVVKKWVKDVDNKFIPTIVAILGIVLASWMSQWQITPEVILKGLISGLGSTGLHQLFTQYIENKNS